MMVLNKNACLKKVSICKTLRVLSCKQKNKRQFNQKRILLKVIHMISSISEKTKGTGSEPNLVEVNIRPTLWDVLEKVS